VNLKKLFAETSYSISETLPIDFISPFGKYLLMPLLYFVKESIIKVNRADGHLIEERLAGCYKYTDKLISGKI
jgi:hypothetical protein